MRRRSLREGTRNLRSAPRSRPCRGLAHEDRPGTLSADVSPPPAEQLADGKLLVDEPAPGVVRLTISNPAKRNALDHPILDAISATLERLAAAGRARPAA